MCLTHGKTDAETSVVVFDEFEVCGVTWIFSQRLRREAFDPMMLMDSIVELCLLWS